MFEKLLAKRHIRELELSSVRAKLMEKQGWDAEKTQAVELDYKRFLYALAHKKPEDILSPPSELVDEFWHQHILDTRKYREDCQRIFGHYVDHTPGLDREKQRQADLRRQEVYRKHNIDNTDFGDSDGDVGGEFDFAGGSHSHAHHGSHSHGHGSHDFGDHGGHDASGHSDGGGHGGDSGSDGGSGGDGGGGDGGGGCGGGGSCGGGGCGGG